MSKSTAADDAAYELSSDDEEDTSDLLEFLRSGGYDSASQVQSGQEKKAKKKPKPNTFKRRRPASKPATLPGMEAIDEETRRAALEIRSANDDALPEPVDETSSLDPMTLERLGFRLYFVDEVSPDRKRARGLWAHPRRTEHARDVRFTPNTDVDELDLYDDTGRGLVAQALAAAAHCK